MATIKAPFNFVPLSDNVFFPEWADQISHDIPFEDGESGTIELKITAETPIFVRNGHTKDDAEAKTNDYKSFSNMNGKYFIPATSIKGAIRNVLEIMSFGKMDRIANQRYSLRDLQLRNEYLNFFQNSDVHCGWMVKKDEEITISDHGIPKRISHIELDKLWRTDFDETFKNAALLKNDANRTALFKYKKAQNRNRTIRYEEFMMNAVNAVDKRIVANVDSKGKHEGTIVMTGQPAARKDRVLSSDKRVIQKGSGKCYEFVFPNTSTGKSFSFSVEDEKYKDFCFFYKESEDWKYWKKELEKGNPVPVFFSLAKEVLSHFGLSYLYKLPYKKRIKELLPKNHQSSNLDLSECIFGCTLKKSTLKGRVQFSHAFLESGSVENELLAYMGSPKSSYYPIYLQQKGVNGYMSEPFITMMSDKAQLKGWKRYPVRDDLMNFTIPEGQDEQSNPFVPMEKGSVFKCRIRFHNLRKAELGALLKSINFNNKGFHSIGFAKPYGYGAVKIEPSISNCKYSLEEYHSAFIDMMKKFEPDFTKTAVLKELNLMSTPQKLKNPLEYMELKDFVACKRQNFNQNRTGEYLDYYSSLVQQEIPVVVSKVLSAKITFCGGGLITAKIAGGNDNSIKTLIIYDKKVKLKAGDIVSVKLSNKKGELIFIGKK